MVKKLILSLSLVSIIAPVHGMWSGVRQTFGRLSGAAVGYMERAHRVAPIAARTVMPKNMPWAAVPVAFKRTLPLKQEEKFKEYVQYLCGDGSKELSKFSSGKSVQEIVDYCLKLTDEEMHHLIDSFAEQGEHCFMESILKELRKRETLPWSPSIKHMVAHPRKYISRHQEDPKEVQELANKLIDYSLEEEKKGNIVFYHAQGWQWQFFELLNRELYKLVGEPIPEDHTMLRFKNASPLNLKEQKELAQRGIRQGDGFDWDRWNGLFCNMGVYACNYGSNSVDYFRDNYDQSTMQKRNVKQEGDLFKAFGKTALFEKIQDSFLFQKLAELHADSSKYGNFVTISLPKELAKEIVYPTISGGPRIAQPNEAYTEDGSNGPRAFKCGVETAENAHKTRFETKFVLVLGKNIIDPKEAAKAGVKVRSWNLSNEKKIALFKDAAQHLIHNNDDVKEREQLENEIVLSTRNTFDLYNNLPLFKRLIDQGLLGINTTLNSDRTAFEHALLREDSESLKQLIEWGADVSDANEAMRIALNNNNKELLELLLQHGADANKGIRSAVYRDNREMVKLLLQYGADVPYEGMYTALNNNNREMIELLLQYGADANKGMTAAVRLNNREMVELLLKHGADANEGMNLAVFNDKKEMVKLLLQHGADANKEMATALNNNNREVVELLLKNGANANEGMSTAVRYINREMAKLLLKHGADANKGMTTAVRYINREMVELLLKHGADANGGMRSAVGNNNKEMVDLFLKNGANANEGMSTAVGNNNKEMVKFLLQHGADVSKGIEEALRNDNKELVKLLREYGAKG